jgi:2-phosphoglycerate kinase
VDRHTYDLESLGQFVDQSRPIMACIDQLAGFAASERQLYVIEGSNIVPGLLSRHDNVSVVEVYLRVSDPQMHRTMLGGPTHDRSLSDAQFTRCREIQSFVVEEASKRGTTVAEFDEGMDTLELLVENAIEQSSRAASTHLRRTAKPAAGATARAENAVALPL